MKKIIIILIIIGIAVVVYFLFRDGDKNKITYQTVVVERNNITNEITATGTIEPITVVEVGTQVSGTISEIFVDFNSEVKKGQVIAKIDPILLQAELTSQEATVASNKAEYEYQTANYNRIKGLHDQKFVSDTDLETAKYQLDIAYSSYQRSQSELIRAKSNLNYATIYSPIDGVVLSRDVDEGQTVAASFSTPTLFTIANDLTKMQVIADVDEADIGQVFEGQRVSFYVDAFPDDIFEGSVTQVRLNPTTESNVVTYQVVVNAPNPDLKLKPGLTANITVYTLEKNNVLTLPLRAFRFTPPTVNTASLGEVPPIMSATQVNVNQKIVYTLTDGEPTPRTVMTGIDDNIIIEVTSGLNEGDRVITGMMTGKAAKEMENIGNGSNNPFVPGRPGGRR